MKLPYPLAAILQAAISMLKVLITIDAETFPISPDWKRDALSADIKRDLYGEVDGHSVGLDYQLATLAQHGLKANFMVESLFSAVPEIGDHPLKTAVQRIHAGGHDIQLHPHPEWLEFIPGIDVPFRSHLLRSYPLAEQESIIRMGRSLLEQAGAPTPVAFRAAGFSANADTLVALRKCGIRYDSSFNRCYSYDESQFPPPQFYGHISDYNGVLEFPVTAFRDVGSHFRSVQVCACTFAEITYALERAESLGWDFFVIVSHSFEMVARRRHAHKPPVIRWQVVDRFKRMCEFLDSNRARFATTKFSELGPLIDRGSPNGSAANIKGRFVNTAQRMFEQAVSRIQHR